MKENNTFSTKLCNESLRFVDPPGPLTALASSPGSGNTWTRSLIQEYTGYHTGAIYLDKVLKEKGFPGEGIVDGRVIVIKTHATIDAKGDLRKYWTNVSPKRYDRVILLIRDPFDTLIAEWNRLYSKSHTGIASEKEVHNTEKWNEYISTQLRNWEDFYTYYIENYKRNQLYILRYEKLKEDSSLEMKKVLKFLGLNFDESVEACVNDTRVQLFKRPKSKKNLKTFFSAVQKENVERIKDKVYVMLNIM